jgi:hypothetical protein
MGEHMTNETDEPIAKALQSIATQLKHLGVGDAATTMGALEFHGTQVKEGAEAIASAIHELASAIDRLGEGLNDTGK